MKTISIALLPGHKSRLFSRRQAVARRLMLGLLEKLQYGCLRLHEGDRVMMFGQAADASDIVADIRVLDPQLYSDLVFGGSIGAGEAYVSSHWETNNLTSVVRIFARNISVLDKLDANQSRLGKWLLRVFHRLNRNSKTGSRNNISAHYDLGNDFFRLFLDQELMYSAAIYPTPDATLAQAAQYKLQRVCEKLQLNAQDHLLEIGTGWGGMALYAARHYGCKVTTTTISREQYEYAKARVRDAGMEDRVAVLFDDYRELNGQFSKLVSIEMIEAVGHQHYDQYFSTCASLLKDDGLMLLQAITISDQRYHNALRSVDFIQRYIFPGGCLPCIGVIADKVMRKTDMAIVGIEEIGDQYARTLKHWREAFMSQLEQVRALGFDDRFIRLWEFYLSYCEGGFMERSIGTAQVLLAKPHYRSNYFSSTGGHSC
ncbi:MAG TPA: cyclopropane-fatty-acyl-phospholipid synthase family protein [Cellvibrio sp.]|nr:cyclopropane-fatty-acyl-phospholipid synthase family protein [Cellvibrio sp.]